MNDIQEIVYDEKQILEIKGKNRSLLYCYELNLYKRLRTFNGIRCLNKWSIINDYIDTKNQLNCLEIGTHEGQSAHYFLKNILVNPASSLICVDPFYKSSWGKNDPLFIDYEDMWDFNKDNNDKNNQLIKYTGLNSDFYTTDTFNNMKIDIAYIDDNHTYESTKLNIETIYTKLKDKGIMIFDDYDATYMDMTNNGKGFYWTLPVRKAVDEFLQKTTMKILYKEYQIILQK